MKKSLRELQKEREDSVSVLMKECGVFFAFSDEQFHKNKTPLQEGEKYVSIGAGGYCPKSKAGAFHEGLEKISSEFSKIFAEDQELRRELIQYELNNHEAYYTGDLEDTLDALGEGFTREEVWKEYNQGQN